MLTYNKVVLGKPGEKRFLLGNEAIVRGALESGINVYTFYPGTPSSEVGEIFIEIFRKTRLKWVENSINEKVALEIAGAAYARGAKAMVGMKNAGLNVAADPLMALATSKPRNESSALVILVADDPQQYSSAIEMDSRFYLKLLKVPALEPSNPQECLDFTKKAFEISRELKIPVILRTVTRVSHARSDVIIGEMKKQEISEDFDLSKERNVASRLYFLDLKEDQIYNRMHKALHLSEKSKLNRIENDQSFNEYKLGIITSGVSYNYTIEALEFLCLKAPILKIGFINPIPEKKVADFLKDFTQVLVVEENDPYLEIMIMAIAHKYELNVKIHGKGPFAFSKTESTLSHVGELNPTKIAKDLIKITGIIPKINIDEVQNKQYQSIRRRPILCPGCPHRTTGYALLKATKKITSLINKKIYFYQDIGCYTLLAYPPWGFANVKYCMGSSIALAQGVAHTSDRLNIALIGDGTFFHSGIPALLNGVYHKAPILVIILDNGWIGMTGQQPHPGSELDYYEEGHFKKKIDLEKFLENSGALISVINHELNDKGNYLSSLKDLIIQKAIDVVDKKELHVLIIKDECIQQNIKRKNPIKRTVDKELCINCGICYNEFLCPAIYEAEGKALIDPGQCLGCGICEEICPNKAIKEMNKNGN